MSEQSEPDKDITIQETAEPPAVVEETLAEEITKDIETGAKPKKPRSEAQKAAFEKARKALVEKRKAATASKPPPKPRGRPKKVAEEPVEKPQKKEKNENSVTDGGAQGIDRNSMSLLFF